MGMSHTDCAHPSTSGARAKCRRANGGGPKKEQWHPPMILPPEGASIKTMPDDNYGQTPRDRDKQCMNCGVEKIAYRGTDPLTHLLIFVGEKCEYMVRRSEDRMEVE